MVYHMYPSPMTHRSLPHLLTSPLPHRSLITPSSPTPFSIIISSLTYPHSLTHPHPPTLPSLTSPHLSPSDIRMEELEKTHQEDRFKIIGFKEKLHLAERSLIDMVASPLIIPSINTTPYNIPPIIHRLSTHPFTTHFFTVHPLSIYPLSTPPPFNTRYQYPLPD